MGMDKRRWRREVKKERRRRLRRKAAQERDAEAEKLKAILEKTAEYLSWVEQDEIKRKEEQIIQEKTRIENEQKWLQEELRAQEEWRSLQERREKARLAQLEQEEMIRKEYEAKQEAIQKKQEEEKHRLEEELKKQEQVQKQIDDYIDHGAKTPQVLRAVAETQPGKEVCQFYAKTGACRYGDMCSRNHQKLSLSKVILMPGFYSHYSLEKNSHDTDASLEYDNSEMRQHFEEFYKDVMPELESFGKIKTLKYCSNTEPHLRGNLYVEYYTERDAARALRKLKGRWFARRQINCEFTGIKSWRTAICGMSRCPKGRTCNFLHVFRNPGNEYDVKSPPRWVKRLEAQESARMESSRRSESRHKSNWDDSVRDDVDNSRNWRWDSPEPESQDRKCENIHRKYPEDRTQTARRSSCASSSRSRNQYENRNSRDFQDFSEEEYLSKHHRNSSTRPRRYESENINGGNESRYRKRDNEKLEYDRYSSRIDNLSYHSRSDRSSRHPKRSHERIKSRKRILKNKEKDSKLSRSSNEENFKTSKSRVELKVRSKWDEDTCSPKAESDSSSSASSSPASSTSSSSFSSRKEEKESKNEKQELKSESTLEPSLEPEPKRHKGTVPEYYDWDTTDSEDEKRQ